MSMWRFLVLAGVALLDGMLLLSFWRQFRRHGTLGLSFFRIGNRAQNIQDAATVLGFVLLTWQAVIATRPSSKFSVLFRTQELLELSRATGAVLLFGGVALCFVAQLHLGASWRIGVKEDAKSSLVTSGFYRFSRNPIFLGLLTAFAGYALLLPTVLSFALLIGAYLGVRRQVAVEEKYLLFTHAEAYRAYAQRVGRFVPLIGRMHAVRTDAHGRQGVGG